MGSSFDFPIKMDILGIHACACGVPAPALSRLVIPALLHAPALSLPVSALDILVPACFKAVFGRVQATSCRLQAMIRQLQALFGKAQATIMSFQAINGRPVGTSGWAQAIIRRVQAIAGSPQAVSMWASSGAR